MSIALNNDETVSQFQRNLINSDYSKVPKYLLELGLVLKIKMNIIYDNPEMKANINLYENRKSNNFPYEDSIFNILSDKSYVNKKKNYDIERISTMQDVKYLFPTIVTIILEFF